MKISRGIESLDYHPITIAIEIVCLLVGALLLWFG